MAISAEMVRALLRQGEGSAVEFKTNLREPGVLARLISAFGNANGGVVLVGVDDRGLPIGADIDQLSRIFHLALAQLVNAPRVDLEAVELNGRRLGVITVGKSDDLVISSEGAYARLDDKTAPLPLERIAAALVPRGAPPPSSTSAIAKAIHRLTQTVDDLHRQLSETNSFRSHVRHYVLGGIVGALISLLLQVLIR
jgi:predicted HTH transcriptional regulator